jgi:hypothetical protein
MRAKNKKGTENFLEAISKFSLKHCSTFALGLRHENSLKKSLLLRDQL